MSQVLLSVYNSLSEYLLTKNINVKVVGFHDFFDRILDYDYNNVVVKNEQDRFNDPWFNLRPSVFLHDQEPIMYTDQKDIWARLHFKHTPFDKRMILLHSERNSTELDRMCNELDIIPCYWFSNAALALEWYQNERWTIHANRYALKYKFSGLNRLISQQRIYRPVLTAYVTDIVDPKYLHWSCSLVDPENNLHALSQDTSILASHHKEMLERYRGMNKPVRINMNMRELDDRKRIANTSPESNREYFNTTFCHIVTETLFYGDTLHLTEKSFRPIVNKRPFILAGPPGSLAYLKEYGFKTFDKFWDESYDNEKDPHNRLDMIVNLIRHLTQNSLSDMESMLLKMQSILDHNHQHFYEKLPNIVKQELLDNLQIAAHRFDEMDHRGWIVSTLSNLDDKKLKALLAKEPSDSLPTDQLYAEQTIGITDGIENNLHRFLVKHLGANKDDTKTSLLAKLDQILK